MRKFITLALIAAAAFTGAPKDDATYETHTVGVLTVTTADGCAIRSEDPHGYAATASKSGCLTVDAITALPHSK